MENDSIVKEPPPKKRRKRDEGSQAEDMSLVTSANVSEREGWQISPLGRITRPVKMRPERPLPEIQQEKLKPTLKKNQVRDVATTKGEMKKRNRRIKGPDSRARRRTIDMTKWGSSHLKGMFLDMPALGMKRLRLDDTYDPIESGVDEGSGDDNGLNVSQSSEQIFSSQTPLSSPLPTNSINISTDIPTSPNCSIKSRLSVGQALLPLPGNNIDLEVERLQSLNLLASLFGGKGDNWVRPESVGSDIDIDELMKGEVTLVDDDHSVEVVPIDNSDSGVIERKKLQDKEKEDKQETENSPARESGAQASARLKDLFAPREEEGKCFKVYYN